MISKLFFSVIGSTGVIGFLVYYILKKSKVKKKLILLFLIISLFLGGGKLAIKNQNSFIYNSKIISTLDERIITNTVLKDSFGKEIDLSFIYNLIVNPIIGSIFIGIAAGGMKFVGSKSKSATCRLLLNNNKESKKYKRGDINGRKEESY